MTAHIQLNYDVARKLAERYGLHTAAATAEFLDIDVELILDVHIRHAYPSDEFMAACLLKLPVRFDDLFQVVSCGVSAA